MSVQIQNTTDEQKPDCTANRFRLPDSTSAMLNWLDEQPGFMKVERTKTYRPFNVETNKRSYRRRDRTEKSVTETFWLHPDYEETTRACHGSQAEVADAWDEMQFPSHRWNTIDGLYGAYSYTWSTERQPRNRFGPRFRNRDTSDREKVKNFEAVQAPDGRGVIQHYDTVAAARTASGLVLVNEQDYGSGFAHVTRPDDWDYELPLDGVGDVLSGHPETIYDIVSVQRDSTRINPTTTRDPIGGHNQITGFRESRQNDRQTTRLDLSSGAAVILLFDSTANNRDETKCGFYLPPEEAAVYKGAAGGLEALRPIDVQMALERGSSIVPADEYAGNGAHGFYNEAILGDAIIRQGEWFLMPMDEDWTPDAPVYKPLPTAGRSGNWEWDHLDIDAESHDFLSMGDGTLPDECPLCGSTSFSVHAVLPTVSCNDCEMEGNYRSLTDEEVEEVMDWERPRDALDALGSHRPRDLAATDEGIYVRGSFRHIDNEHKMVNLRDRWHLAVENTRDVTVFDLGADTVGVARYE